MAKITTPVEGFNGKVAGVTFVDGAGETKDEAEIAYFQRQGYTVTGVKAAPTAEEKAAEKASSEKAAAEDAAAKEAEKAEAEKVAADKAAAEASAKK